MRWKESERERRLMLAGRGYFFRGILAKGESLPTVRFSEQLWNVRKEGAIWAVEKLHE